LPRLQSARDFGRRDNLEIGEALFKAALLSTLFSMGTALGSRADSAGNNADIVHALRRGSSDSITDRAARVDLAASTHRDLIAYAKVLAQDTRQTIVEPVKLVGPILAQFMAADRQPIASSKESTPLRSDWTE